MAPLTRALLHGCVLSLLWGCAGWAPPPSDLVEPPGRQPISGADCHVTLTPHDVLRADVEAAAERWSGSTGCDIEVGEGGVPVELVLRIQRPDGSDAPGATAADRSYVHISSRVGSSQRARTVLHELGHLLGMNGEHAVGVIDAEALSEVCSARACSAFRPEA